jgi:putative tricarboxylic transport membrane protein
MHPRFSYGSHYLEAGVGLVAAIVGLFGLSQVMVSMRDPDSKLVAITRTVSHIVPPWREIVGRWRVVLQSGVIGTFIGILPGLGADMGAWISYDAAKRTSRERAKFG